MILFLLFVFRHQQVLVDGQDWWKHTRGGAYQGVGLLHTKWRVQVIRRIIDSIL